MTEATAPEVNQADIVVVGAGMAGLYSAWRMLRHRPATRIVILEMLDRPGGRLDTDLVLIDGKLVKNEEGGMRFVKSMANLMWLLLAISAANANEASTCFEQAAAIARSKAPGCWSFAPVSAGRGWRA